MSVHWLGKLRRLVPLVLVAALLAAFLAGDDLRESLGFELSTESVRAWVARLGWWAPVSFVGLVTFRHAVLLPSGLVLTAGGLCFGVIVGSLLGTVGVILSAALNFSIARGIIWRRPSVDVARVEPAAARAMAERTGPFAVAVGTGHPMAPLAVVHWAAGLSSLSFSKFWAAAALGAPFRAVAYSVLGSSLADVGSRSFYATSAILLALILLPLAHPRVRAWVRRA